MASLDQIRRQMRQRRQILTVTERLQAAARIEHHLGRHPLFRHSDRVAAYLAIGGEADPLFLIERAWSLGKKVFLPALAPATGNRLWFLPFGPSTPLAENRFGIPEPDIDPGKRIPATALDLVLAPLVAFDPSGSRLGMGGGYYDASFGYLRLRHHWRKPRLIGVAYEFQAVARLDRQAWDIPLDGVVTESRLRLFL